MRIGTNEIENKHSIKKVNKAKIYLSEKTSKID